MKKGLITAIVMCLGLTSVASLAGASPINRREHRQQRRIVHGVRSGRLTGREFRRLEFQQARIRFAGRRFRRSGNGLNFRERARLNCLLNRSGRDIRRDKHNRRTW